MDGNHALVCYGKKRMNWQNPPSSDTFLDTRKKPVEVRGPIVSGIRFGLLELTHENECIVFRIEDVVLHDSVALPWHGPESRIRIGPRGKRIDDNFASKLLEEAIRINPEQTNVLSNFRKQID